MLEAIFIAQSYYPKKIQVWYIYLLECLILMVNVFFVIIPYIDAMNFCSLKSRFQVAKKNSMPSAFSWITWSGKNYPAELLKLSPLSNNTPSRVIFRSVIAELYYYFHNPELVLTFLFVTNISRPIPQFWSWWLSPFRVWTGICIRSQVRVCML